MALRLLSATARMKFSTAAEAVLAGPTAPAPLPLHAARSAAVANHRRWITSLSLASVSERS